MMLCRRSLIATLRRLACCGVAAVVDDKFHGKKEFGLPLAGKLQGVLVTGLEDDDSRIVAVTVLFSGDGEDR
jgi:hypothetical protein|uniref:Uncharacterized protein n=2 Tax=Oryza TaxID=4527 RepID=A0A0D3F7U9_9ORYZ